MVNKDELVYKIEEIIKYLKVHNGYDYKLYNQLCPDDDINPDSNIVEYALDVLDIVNKLMGSKENNDGDYYIVALKRVMGNASNLVNEILNEVHFLKDIYTEEEIHNKLKEIDKM